MEHWYIGSRSSSAEGTFLECDDEGSLPKPMRDDLPTSLRSTCQGENAWSFISPFHLHPVWKHLEGRSSLLGS